MRDSPAISFDELPLRPSSMTDRQPTREPSAPADTGYDLTVIIVSYRVRHFLAQCLDSLYQAQGTLRLEVYVVDNASGDDTVPYIRERFPRVNLIANDRNVGFARANNQALRVAKGRYALLLNPDTLVGSDTLTKCLEYMDSHPHVGGLGVRMVDGSGNYLPESKRGLPTPFVAATKMLGLARLFPKSPVWARYYLGHLKGDKPEQIDVLSGAFMWMRPEALAQSGLLDESYFMYGEDIDLSYRLTLAGFQNHYLPTTTIVHYKGESTRRASVNYVQSFYRAMLIFYRQHFRSRWAGVTGAAIQAAIYLRALYALIARWMGRFAHPLIDGAILMVGLWVLKEFYELNYKHNPTFYPDEYLTVVMPLYVLAWLGAGLILGIYERPYHLRSLIMATAAGAVLISAGSNFLDEYRYSKAIIVLGTLWAFTVFILTRLARFYIMEGGLSLSNQPLRRFLYLGEGARLPQLERILERASRQHRLVGYVSSQALEAPAGPPPLGHPAHLEALIRVMDIDEVIVDTQTYPYGEAIHLMMTLGGQGRAVSLYHPDEGWVIGSQFSDRQGTIYADTTTFLLTRRGQLRQKRILDFILATVLLLASPLMVWFTKNRRGFFINMVNVVRGRLTFVGLAYPLEEAGDTGLLPGIITPAGPPHLMDLLPGPHVARQIEQLYARDYHLGQDLALIVRYYSYLGGVSSDYALSKVPGHKSTSTYSGTEGMAS